MSASDTAYVRWFFRDWLLSKTRLRMESDQRGAYFDILCLMYDSADGCIEWDECYLHHLTGVEASRLIVVRKAFSMVGNGRWTHHRVQSEIDARKKLHDASVRGGKTRARQLLNKGYLRGTSGIPQAPPEVAEHSRAEQSIAEDLDSLQESKSKTPPSTPPVKRKSERASSPVSGLGPEPRPGSIAERIKEYATARPWLRDGWAEKLYDGDDMLMSAYVAAYGHHPDIGPT